MNVDASITIDRAAADVFAFVTDVSNMATWVTGVSSAELRSDGMAEGARFVCRYTSALRPNEVEIEVTTYEPPSRFGLRSARGPINFEGTLSIDETPDGTRVTNTIVADPDSLATRLASILFGWFIRPSMRKRLARELEALRAAMTGRLTDA